VSAAAQSLLANLKESFRVFIESVPDAMVLSDRSGRIVLVNSNRETLFGYSRAELLGKKVEILIPARFHAQQRRHRADHYSDPSIRPMEKGGSCRAAVGTAASFVSRSIPARYR
jgi:PAS domain S-box-containing protein